ncbi:uncharacterized protein [Leptinotarsa decemlineata]|uniref:uncharacterized protein n=1 Tax=Leptinotarsa decemlineata TaxID=7539 RepID=UPI003D304F65
MHVYIAWYHKENSGKKFGFLHSMPKYARPHHTLHLDHLGPFVHGKGNKYILIIVDGFSKFTFLKAAPNTTTKCALVTLSEICTIFGNPKRIITDAGKGFVFNEFKQYLERKGIRLHTIAVGLPRGNAQAERVNKTILDALETSEASVNGNEWDSKVATVQQGNNNTKHLIIQNTPAELLFGFSLKMDGDIHDNDEEREVDVTAI